MFPCLRILSTFCFVLFNPCDLVNKDTIQYNTVFAVVLAVIVNLSTISFLNIVFLPYTYCVYTAQHCHAFSDNNLT